LPVIAFRSCSVMSRVTAYNRASERELEDDGVVVHRFVSLNAL
jgi:hypothetical protein